VLLNSLYYAIISNAPDFDPHYQGPAVDPDCFSDCMNTWLGGDCLRYALGVGGAAGVSAAGSTPLVFAGIHLPAYWVGGYSLGLATGSSTVATVAIGAGATVVWSGGILAAAGVGWGVGTFIQCWINCSE
jgi:hypothetical protein